jgi:hypothetical protein
MAQSDPPGDDNSTMLLTDEAYTSLLIDPTIKSSPPASLLSSGLWQIHPTQVLRGGGPPQSDTWPPTVPFAPSVLLSNAAYSDFCADRRVKSSPPATRSTSLPVHWLVHVLARLLDGQDTEEKPPAYAGPITLFVSGKKDRLAKFIAHCKENTSTTLLVTTNKPIFTHATFANPEAADSVTAFLTRQAVRQRALHHSHHIHDHRRTT